MLVKNLPSNKELKKYYSDYFRVNRENLNVLKVTKSKNAIDIECTYDNELSYIPPFFINIFCINTLKKEIHLTIDSECFEHVFNRYRSNADYLSNQ